MSERKSMTYLDFLKGRVQPPPKRGKEPTYLDFIRASRPRI